MSFNLTRRPEDIKDIETAPLELLLEHLHWRSGIFRDASGLDFPPEYKAQCEKNVLDLVEEILRRFAETKKELRPTPASLEVINVTMGM